MGTIAIAIRQLNHICIYILSYVEVMRQFSNHTLRWGPLHRFLCTTHSTCEAKPTESGVFKSKSRDCRFFILIACFLTAKLTALISLFQLLNAESQGLKKHWHWEMFRIVTMQLNFLIDYEWSGIRPIMFLSNFDSKLTSSDVLWEEKFAINKGFKPICHCLVAFFDYEIWPAIWLPASPTLVSSDWTDFRGWWYDGMMQWWWILRAIRNPERFNRRVVSQTLVCLGQQIQRYFWTAHHWEKQGRHMDVLFGWVLSQWPTVDAPGLFP